MVNELEPNQIFIFGSNLAGNHAGGAAKQAYEQFGAEMGIGEGLSGSTYAFPTLERDMNKRGIRGLQASRDRLYATARTLPEKEFLLTPVGTCIAGYDYETIDELFVNLPNNIKKVGWRNMFDNDPNTHSRPTPDQIKNGGLATPDTTQVSGNQVDKLDESIYLYKQRLAKHKGSRYGIEGSTNMFKQALTDYFLEIIGGSKPDKATERFSPENNDFIVSSYDEKTSYNQAIDDYHTNLINNLKEEK